MNVILVIFFCAALISCQSRNNNDSQPEAVRPVKRLAGLNDVPYGIGESGTAIGFKGRDQNATFGTADYFDDGKGPFPMEWAYNSDGVTLRIRKKGSDGKFKDCARGIQIVETSVLQVPQGADCMKPGTYGLNR